MAAAETRPLGVGLFPSFSCFAVALDHQTVGAEDISLIRTERRLSQQMRGNAMSGRTERSIEELYRDDPERADALVFGRETGAKPPRIFRRRRSRRDGCRCRRRHPVRAKYAGWIDPGSLGARRAGRASSGRSGGAAAPKGPQYLQFPGQERQACRTWAKSRSWRRRPRACWTTIPRRPTNSSSAIMVSFRIRPRMRTAGRSRSMARSTTSSNSRSAN